MDPFGTDATLGQMFRRLLGFAPDQSVRFPIGFPLIAPLPGEEENQERFDANRAMRDAGFPVQGEEEPPAELPTGQEGRDRLERQNVNHLRRKIEKFGTSPEKKNQLNQVLDREGTFGFDALTGRKGTG